MNQPMNPVLRPGTLSLPAKTPEKQPRKLKGRVSISIADDFRLGQWLHAHEFKPGETLATIAALAGTALGIPDINAAHIQNRMAAYGLKLVPSVPKDAPASRIATLEKRVEELEKIVRAMGGQYINPTMSGSSELMTQIKEWAERQGRG